MAKGFIKPLRYNPQNYTEKVMEHLEPYVVMSAKRWGNIKGYDCDDIAQELREFLWDKVRHYNPRMGAIHNWAYTTMKRRLSNLNDPKRYRVDALDADYRVPYIEEE